MQLRVLSLSLIFSAILISSLYQPTPAHAQYSDIFYPSAPTIPTPTVSVPVDKFMPSFSSTYFFTANNLTMPSSGGVPTVTIYRYDNACNTTINLPALPYSGSTQSYYLAGTTYLNESNTAQIRYQVYVSSTDTYTFYTSTFSITSTNCPITTSTPTPWSTSTGTTFQDFTSSSCNLPLFNPWLQVYFHADAGYVRNDGTFIRAPLSSCVFTKSGMSQNYMFACKVPSYITYCSYLSSSFSVDTSILSVYNVNSTLCTLNTSYVLSCNNNSSVTNNTISLLQYVVDDTLFIPPGWHVSPTPNNNYLMIAQGGMLRFVPKTNFISLNGNYLYPQEPNFIEPVHIPYNTTSNSVTLFLLDQNFNILHQQVITPNKLLKKTANTQVKYYYAVYNNGASALIDLSVPWLQRPLYSAFGSNVTITPITFNRLSDNYYYYVHVKQLPLQLQEVYASKVIDMSQQFSIALRNSQCSILTLIAVNKTTYNKSSTDFQVCEDGVTKTINLPTTVSFLETAEYILQIDRISNTQVNLTLRRPDSLQVQLATCYTDSSYTETCTSFSSTITLNRDQPYSYTNSSTTYGPKKLLIKNMDTGTGTVTVWSWSQYNITEHTLLSTVKTQIMTLTSTVSQYLFNNISMSDELFLMFMTIVIVSVAVTRNLHVVYALFVVALALALWIYDMEIVTNAFLYILIITAIAIAILNRYR